MLRLLVLWTITLTLCATGLAAAIGDAATAKAVYAGRTSQGHPLMLAVERGHVAALSGEIDVRCDSGRTISIDLYFRAKPKRPGERIRRDGSFGRTEPFTGTASTGEKLNFSGTLRGRLGRKRGTARDRVSGPVTDAAGNTTDHCDSGAITWRLTRGSSYGGDLHTAAHGPLTIQLARGGRSIKSFLVAFMVHCDNGQDYRFTIEHLAVPVGRRGRFAKRGMTAVPLRGPDNSTISGHYRLTGKLGARTASGTYRATGVAQQGGVKT